MNLLSSLQEILEILRPHCSELPLQQPKTELDEAFKLVAGLILEIGITDYIHSVSLRNHKDPDDFVK
jgi:hypothetical protein